MDGAGTGELRDRNMYEQKDELTAKRTHGRSISLHERLGRCTVSKQGMYCTVHKCVHRATDCRWTPNLLLLVFMSSL